jgi:3-oxoacyl-[acyl-carrier-protein] synthase III
LGAFIRDQARQAVEAGRLKRGDQLSLAAFAAGFTWGGALLRWA